jgi:predicted nuclease of predicted toxin-antitoxin system
LSTLRGWPPKIVWLRSADTSTQAILDLLQRSTTEIEHFLADETTACLVVGKL